jgi:hypothetical protein
MTDEKQNRHSGESRNSPMQQKGLRVRLAMHKMIPREV